MSERIESDVEFRAAVLQAIDRAVESLSPALVLCDPGLTGQQHGPVIEKASGSGRHSPEVVPTQSKAIFREYP
jgi:hypothetical protein